MGTNDSTPPSGQQQSPVSDPPRLDKLEERVRTIEDKITMVSGVMSILKWIGPSLLIAGTGVLLYFLGKASS